MNSRAAVAIILAITVMLILVGSTGSFRSLLGLGPIDNTTPPDLLSAWENVMFTIIGALAGYITGRADD